MTVLLILIMFSNNVLSAVKPSLPSRIRPERSSFCKWYSATDEELILSSLLISDKLIGTSSVNETIDPKCGS